MDLRVGPPRRWTAQLGGIRWLPRLIDKARAALDGSLGDYLYGQSPMDRDLLNKLGCSYADFTTAVRSAANDDDVFGMLLAGCPEGVERARAWSAALPRTHWLFLAAMDADDGYLNGPIRLLKRPMNAASGAFTRWLKRVRPYAVRRT